MVSTYGAYWHWVRFGPGYRKHLSTYLERERFTARQWDVLQREQLSHVLAAAGKIPYYRGAWGRGEVKAAEAGRLEDLPLLGKDPIREDPTAFCREDVRPSRRMVFQTSGSTGTPVACIWTFDEVRKSLALREARSARWAGVSYRLPRATFSGRLVEPSPESRGPFYRFNLPERQVYMSTFHLGPDTAARYVEALRHHKIQWLTGYAVSYYLLANFILEQSLTVPPLRAIVTTSEKVTSGMRRVMVKAFRCRVFEEYSSVENAVFASECEFGRLHVSPDAGVVEILRPDGTPCAANEVGEVVTTCLMRTYQPFIRYRLGDLACWSSESCGCGRSMPVLKEVVGRLEDVVVGPDGRLMVRFHGIFVEHPNVREGQIIQEELDRIRVKVVPVRTPFGSDDAQEIVWRVRQRLGSEVSVVVEPVESIPRTAGGKFRAVVSLLTDRADATSNKSSRSAI